MLRKLAWLMLACLAIGVVGGCKGADTSGGGGEEPEVTKPDTGNGGDTGTTTPPSETGTGDTGTSTTPPAGEEGAKQPTEGGAPAAPPTEGGN